MKKTLKLALFGAAFSAVTSSGLLAADCAQLAASVTAAVNEAPAKVLETVQSQIAANSGCACEIVRAAITASDAEKDAVAAIVRTAIMAAPEEARLIAQCAVATAPDAIAEVQAVLSSLEPAQGETVSEKGGLAKGGEAPAPFDANPLDFPLGDAQDQIVTNPAGGTPTGPIAGPPAGGPGGPGVFLPPGGLGGAGGGGGTPPIVTNPEVSTF